MYTHCMHPLFIPVETPILKREGLQQNDSTGIGYHLAFVLDHDALRREVGRPTLCDEELATHVQLARQVRDIDRGRDG